MAWAPEGQFLPTCSCPGHQQPGCGPGTKAQLLCSGDPPPWKTPPSHLLCEVSVRLGSPQVLSEEPCPSPTPWGLGVPGKEG